MACSEAGCALLGGETAEHPGLLGPDDYDLAGAATGVVERDKILGAERVVAGDVVLAMASSGLHSNGYSLVRHVVGTQSGWTLDRYVPELGQTLGDELLTPTRIYARDCLAMFEAVEVHAMSHITGGGLANNLARVIPPTCEVRIDRATWLPPAIFGLLQQLGTISQPDLEATLQYGRRDGCCAAASRGRRGRAAAGSARPPCVGMRGGYGCESGSTRARTPRRTTRCGIGSLRFAPLGALGSLSLTTLTILQPRLAAGRHSARGSTRWGAAVQKQSRRRLLANSSTVRSTLTSRRWSKNFGAGQTATRCRRNMPTLQRSTRRTTTPRQTIRPTGTFVSQDRENRPSAFPLAIAWTA